MGTVHLSNMCVFGAAALAKPDPDSPHNAVARGCQGRGPKRGPGRSCVTISDPNSSTMEVTSTAVAKFSLSGSKGKAQTCNLLVGSDKAQKSPWDQNIVMTSVRQQSVTETKKSTKNREHQLSPLRTDLRYSCIIPHYSPAVT